MFVTVNDLLTARGLLLKAGTVVNTTLIAAPTSTKNKDKKRDPDMHSSKKGNQWYFGMKAHIGADATPDATWHVAMRPGKRKVLDIDNEADALID
jgi:IS5 family transposase